MPVALSSNFTTDVILPLHEHEPEESRLTFKVRFLTIMQSRTLSAAMGGQKSDSWDLWRQRLNACITETLVSVGNAPGGKEATTEEVVDLSDPDGKRKVKVTPLLDELLIDGELRDLAQVIIAANRVGYEELKKSKLQQPSAAA